MKTSALLPPDATWTRRELLRTAALIPGAALLTRAPGALAAPASSAALRPQTPHPAGFCFHFLGDLHFDRMQDHDMGWLMKEKPNDLRQIQNYSRLTTEVLPGLMQAVRQNIATERAAGRVHPFLLQAGDFVEGLAGTPELARQHCAAAAEFVRQSKLDTPFLFTKGNHDVTGPGSVEAFNEMLVPFLVQQKAMNPSLVGLDPVNSSNYAFRYQNALFCCFDAYVENSLTWLEETLRLNPARHVFVVIHPPVVPYGARSLWHLYARPRELSRREQLLDLLGKYHAIVLGGHIHKYSVLSRATGNGGKFVQVALSSVIPRPDRAPDEVLEGLVKYTPDQILVEPRFSPANEAERRAALAAEAPAVRSFEYADAPGYARIAVGADEVEVQFFSGLSQTPWRKRNLTALLREAG